MTYVVYKHTNKKNGKAYIGITSDYDRRSADHRRMANTKGKKFAFHLAIRKYGWDGFTHEILHAGLTLEEANAAEVAAIASHGTLEPDGYNLCTGGGCASPSPATLEKMKAPKSPEHIEAVRDALYSDPQKAAAKSEKRANTVRGTKYDTSRGGAKAMWENRTQAEKDAIQAKRLAKLDRAAQAEKVKAAHAAMTEEEKAQRAANIRAALAHRVQTPEQKEAARLRRNELQRLRRAAKVLP